MSVKPGEGYWPEMPMKDTAIGIDLAQPGVDKTVVTRVEMGNLVRQVEPGEALLIGPDIEVHIVSIKGHRAKIAIKAPKSLKINRRPPA